MDRLKDETKNGVKARIKPHVHPSHVQHFNNGFIIKLCNKIWKSYIAISTINEISSQSIILSLKMVAFKFWLRYIYIDI